MRVKHKTKGSYRGAIRINARSIVTSLALLLFCTTAFAQKVTKTSADLTPLSVRVTPQPTAIVNCLAANGPSNSQVQLNAETNSPSGHQLRYSWTATAGRIVGEGPSVTWDLSGVQPGYYKAVVTTYTGSGGVEECEAFSSTTVLVSPCAPLPPTCPTVAIACPQNLGTGKPLVFSASLTGGSSEHPPIYNWVVSTGQIIEGQGTSSIKVDNAGLGGQSLTATLSLEGYNLDCSASCTISIPVPASPSRKFDEFPDIARNDEKARLDNFAIDLQNEPRATAYVIIYPSSRGGAAEAQRRSTRIVDYLVNTRGIDSHRIVTLTGPARRKLQVELWIAPEGANPPTVPER